MYHHVESVNPNSTIQGHYVSPQLFRRQMKVMKATGWKAVRLTDAIALWESGKPVEPKSFVITFDDGYLNFHANAMPILSELGFPSTVFLVSECVGKINEWNREKHDVTESLMGVDQIREAMKHGVEFGSHTLTHKNLETASPVLARDEIYRSKDVLEQMLGSKVTAFCYPYGAFREETRSMVEDAGYQSACSTMKGFNDSSTDRFLLKRLNIRRDTSVPILLYKLWRGQRFDR